MKNFIILICLFLASCSVYKNEAEGSVHYSFPAKWHGVYQRTGGSSVRAFPEELKITDSYMMHKNFGEDVDVYRIDYIYSRPQFSVDIEAVYEDSPEFFGRYTFEEVDADTETIKISYFFSSHGTQHRDREATYKRR